MQSELFNYLVQKRKDFYRAWTEETASPKLRPISGKPLSTGQCSATSIELQKDLRKDFNNLDTQLVLGAVYTPDGEVLIDIHVWLYAYSDRFEEPLVLDITADQSTSIGLKIICDKPSDLLKKGFVYQVHDTPKVLRTGTHERAKLLRKRLLALSPKAIAR